MLAVATATMIKQRKSVVVRTNVKREAKINKREKGIWSLVSTLLSFSVLPALVIQETFLYPPKDILLLL